MADSTPPQTPLSTTTHTKNMMRNVLVGVITTILGTSSVYFLGFQKNKSSSSAEDLLVMKEATSKAWKSYVGDDNLYFKNVMALNADVIKDKRLDLFKQNMLSEIHHYQSDLDDFLKTESLDPSFISLLKRRKESEKTAEGIFTKYMDDVTSLVNSGLDNNTLQQRMQPIQTEFNEQGKSIVERTVNELEVLSKTLTDKYNEPFNVTDFEAYQYLKKNDLNTDNQNNNNGNNTNQNNNNGNQTNNNNNNNNNNPNQNNNNGDNTNQNNNNGNALSANSIVGYWSTQDADIDLLQDGSFYWDLTVTAKSTQGKWQITNNQLSMKPNAGQGYDANTVWIFNVSNISQNAITFQLAGANSKVYNLKREQNNN